MHSISQGLEGLEALRDALYDLLEFRDKLKAVASWPTGLPEASTGTIRVKVGFPRC
jgi:pyridoxal 5'-phosphate synthase pdxS subunit